MAHMRLLLLCSAAAAFAPPAPRIHKLPSTRVLTQPLRAAPLYGKTRALQETTDDHDWGDDVRRALKQFQDKLTKYVMVVAARIRLTYLKARAFSRTEKGRRICGLAAILLFAVLTRKARVASAAKRAGNCAM